MEMWDEAGGGQTLTARHSQGGSSDRWRVLRVLGLKA
jgi:hypothetical protein